MIQRRRPQIPLDPTAKLHWATAYIAREHRRTDIEELQEWLCPCHSCNHVRAEIYRTCRVEDHARLLAVRSVA